MSFKITDYPWAKELSLNFRGDVNPIVKGCHFAVVIYYLENQVYQFTAPVQNDPENGKRYFIDMAREPINLAAEEVLPGKYTIQITLELSSQSGEFQDMWSRDFPKDTPNVFVKSFQLGNAQMFAKRSESIRKFYLTRMRNMNALFKLLQEKKKIAIKARRDGIGGRKNEFSNGQTFDPNKWRGWFNSHFLFKMEAEKQLLEKHAQRLFCLRFGVTHSSMSNACDLMIRIARLHSASIYKYYKLGQDRENLQQMDQFAIQNIADLIRNLQRLHSLSAKELDISLRKELGYLPPYIVR